MQTAVRRTPRSIRGGQLGQPAGRADRRRRTEQLEQQLVVDVGPPGQPGVPHLRRRPARRPTRRPPAAGTGRDAPVAAMRRVLVGVHLDQGLQGVVPGSPAGPGRVSKSAAWPCPGGSAWPRRRVGRDRGPGQPGPGGGRRARLAPAPGVAQQQRLGQLDVVAALRRAPRRAAAAGYAAAVAARPSADGRRPPGRRRRRAGRRRARPGRPVCRRGATARACPRLLRHHRHQHAGHCAARV